MAGAARLTAHGSGGGGRRLGRRGGAGGGGVLVGAAVRRRFRRLGNGRVARPASRQRRPAAPQPRRPYAAQRPHVAPGYRPTVRRLDRRGRAVRIRLHSMTIADPVEPAPADTAVTFADLQIHPSVLQAVADVGYESPSPIQAATIPALMAGSDVVGLAQTGTGKTAAFAIPILSKIDVTSKATQALVLAPTRELALQVAEAFSRYGAHLPQINVLPIYGGSSYARAAGRAAPRRPGGGRHPGPGHRPPRARDPGPVAPGLPGARRGRRDAADGLRRGRRTHPGRHPGVQAGGAVLGDHAARPSARSPPSTCTIRSRSPSKRKPRRPRTFRSATSRSPARARWTR